MSQSPRYCFIATLGRTGQVITEALDALLEEKGIVPFRIEIITTDIEGTKKKCPNASTDMPVSERDLRNKIAELYVDRKENPSVWNNVGLVHPNPRQFVDVAAKHVVFNYVEDPDDPKKYLKDIETAEHHKAFMKLIDERTRLRGRSEAEMINPDSDDAPRLIMLLAGGRKTMSSGAQEIMVFRGRRDDKLYHILVKPSWIEEPNSHNLFWFRKTVGEEEKKDSRDKVNHNDKENLKLNLIELEYGIASLVFDYDELPISYELALKAMNRFRDSVRTELVIDLDARTISYGGIMKKGKIEERIVRQIAPLPLAYFAALAEVSPRRVDLLTLECADTASSDRQNFPSFREILLKKEKLIDPVRAEQRIQAKAALLHFFADPNYKNFEAFHLASTETETSGQEKDFNRGRISAEIKPFPKAPFSNADIFEIILAIRKLLPTGSSVILSEDFRTILTLHNAEFADSVSRNETINEKLLGIADTNKKNIERFFSDEVLLKKYPGEEAVLAAAQADRAMIISKLNTALRLPDENFFVSSDIIVKGFSKKARDREKLTSSEARDFSTDDGMYLLPNRTIVELSDDQEGN